VGDRSRQFAARTEVGYVARHRCRYGAYVTFSSRQGARAAPRLIGGCRPLCQLFSLMILGSGAGSVTGASAWLTLLEKHLLADELMRPQAATTDCRSDLPLLIRCTLLRRHRVHDLGQYRSEHAMSVPGSPGASPPHFDTLEVARSSCRCSLCVQLDPDPIGDGWSLASSAASTVGVTRHRLDGTKAEETSDGPVALTCDLSLHAVHRSMKLDPSF